MIVIIILIALVTLFALSVFYFNYDKYNDMDDYTYKKSKQYKRVTVSIAILILIWCSIAFISECFGIYRGVSISYTLEYYIFEDHWFLSSLLFGSISFLIFASFKKFSLIKRNKMLANETDAERVQREEKEAKELEEKREIARVRSEYYAEQQAKKQRLQTASAQSYTELKCPKCNSTNLTANTKGFGLGKAAVGGVLLGPVGLLGGLVGSKKPVFICLKCGNQFEK